MPVISESVQYFWLPNVLTVNRCSTINATLNWERFTWHKSKGKLLFSNILCSYMLILVLQRNLHDLWFTCNVTNVNRKQFHINGAIYYFHFSGFSASCSHTNIVFSTGHSWILKTWRTCANIKEHGVTSYLKPSYFSSALILAILARGLVITKLKCFNNYCLLNIVFVISYIRYIAKWR